MDRPSSPGSGRRADGTELHCPDRPDGPVSPPRRVPDAHRVAAEPCRDAPFTHTARRIAPLKTDRPYREGARQRRIGDTDDGRPAGEGLPQPGDVVRVVGDGSP